MKVPLTVSVRLSVASLGPGLKTLTVHTQSYLSGKRDAAKKEERNEEKRDLNKSF